MIQTTHHHYNKVYMGREMKKKNPRKLEDKNVSQLQKKLWPLFALYIKTTHSVDGEWCNCFTCDKPVKIGTAECQAGHFISRSYSPVKYDEDNVRPQCSTCNGYGNGKPIEFERRLKLQIGDDKVELLKATATNRWKWDKLILIDMIQNYKEQLSS